ncbi:hypothetical protein [Halorubrum vacuolatum]|uniref:DNA primase catalytic core, N-terminal domain n=1 Tax=Halorubrum vacuolatum TaxID=63740 RepID=A0A238W7D1_HALVU|nr:hypothetical protein [Halorubrum vacuolatum]SNR42452.1 DNA primase catalytic core, N-terminal domain [Halorubrum vacuolatum]
MTAAFTAAIDWFSQQLDTELPKDVQYSTPREYYRDARGWGEDTIEAKQLGYAPADTHDRLLAYLHRRGFDRRTIIATGLFQERGDGNLSAAWSGRYVLPYLDEDGRAVFAITRALDPAHSADWAGRYGEEDDPAKYHKIAVSSDEVVVEEPIYGLDTVREGEPVIITEGIADAITAHQNGLPALSPVTTTFKKSDREDLLDVLQAYDVPRVYIVQDAEEPSSAIDENDRLTLPQYGEGLRGAVSTGAFLTEAGVDARIAELPRPGLSKVDLDDYLIEWDGDLAPVLAAAVRATDHPAYTEPSTNSSQSDTEDRDTSTVSSSNGRSALFDLDITDVTGLSEGDRGKNPLGHHGESENYFVVKRAELATDFKYGVSYNALTYILVEADGRRADDPDGSLDDDEVFTAWKHAKDQSYVSNDDPVPYRGLIGVALKDGLVHADDLVRRDTDTGEVVADPEDHDGKSYRALPSGAYNQVLDHISEEYDVDPGREPVGAFDGEEDDSGEEYRDDPREIGATVDVRRAWDAAARVTPDEVEGLDAAPDAPERFACPATGEAVDVVRAVAVAEGIVDGPEDDLGDAYAEAYATARDQYEAPLPKYYTTRDAIAEFDAVLDVIGEATFWDLDTDALATEVTAEGDEVGGEAARALNPAWRDSEGEASVLVFPSGTVWDADTERVLDVVRFAALDAGIVRHPDDPLEGSDFVDAYAAARDQYGAPLPRWKPAEDGSREVTPQLPTAEELVDARELDGVDPDALDEARADVEELIGDATAEDGSPTVVAALPATGKTTGTVKTARDRPLSYLAPRKELQAQALEKADRWGVDARILPVFAEENVRDDVLAAATKYIREGGKDRLRDRWSLVSRALEGTGGDDEDVDVEDIFVEEETDEDDVDLDRPTCPVADGEYGPAWALVVHVARRLGYTPREIHTEAAGLFGADLPCSEDGATCPYTEGWEHASDADDTADLLVGSYVHAHVASVRTAYSRDAHGRVDTAPRAVVLDEFVGEAFTREFDDLAPDHATWLARSLREDVEDQRDMYEADLSGDEWVRAWLEGRVDDLDAVDQAVAALARMGDLLDAREDAGEILSEVDDDLLRNLGVREALEDVSTGDDAAEAFRDLTDALDALDPEQPGAGVERWIRPAVVEPLARATLSGVSNPDLAAVELGELPIAGDLRLLVEEAVEAVRDGTEAASARLNAAMTALRGSREGCRRLAAWATDGYAHPDAHHLLEAVVADEPRRIHTDAWAFDDRATDGTTLDVVDTHGRATTVLDRNGHGALLHNPPARTDAGGEDVPLVALDATGRAELWSVALGEDVSVDDIHDSAAERATFLEDALDLRVLRAADRPRYYEGSPASKDTDGDVALLEALAEEYAGIDAPRRRDEAASTVGKPAAITTKGVREVLENDARLDGVVSTWENYGNLKGSNELGDQRLAAILGCQHYGDHAIERFAALGGEEVDTDRRSGRGADLAYGSEIGDAYLKHMTEDQTMQAILRFARGGSGATVVARTSALRSDLPVVGEGQVVETWSETATKIASHYRTLGREFTTADVRDVVDVGPRQVRRVLAELADAGYIRRVKEADGRATTYERVEDPNAGEVDLPSREEAVAPVEPGNSATKECYTWNVRVQGRDPGSTLGTVLPEQSPWAAPPAPDTFDGVEPPS